MYIMPQKYVCPKGHEFMWSPHDQQEAPYIKGTNDGPVCPTCYNEWLRNTFQPSQPAPPKIQDDNRG